MRLELESILNLGVSDFNEPSMGRVEDVSVDQFISKHKMIFQTRIE
jgi:hypothetical protein